MQEKEDEEFEFILNGLPPEVIENFHANDIKLQHLPSITDELLKELCPKVGIRIELRNRINEYLTSKTNTVTATTSTTLNQYDENDDVILEDINNVICSSLFCPRPELPDFDLKTLLSTSPCGNSILNYYASHSTLTNRHRNQLTDIIVRHLFTRLVNHKITSEEYNIITSKIISLFPKENSGIYYVPPVKKRESISGKPLFSKGKLVDKIRNTLYKSGEKRKISPDENENSLKKKRLSELQDKNTDKIHFLQNNNEPWSQILEYWQDTFIIRKDTEYKNISEFIEGWRILNDPRSEVLINLDFNMMYPNSSSKFFNNWEIFINRIISIKFPKQCDDILAALNEKIQNEQNQENKIPNQIKLLCYLIPPRGRLNKRTKFSTLECLENFIIDVEKPGDLHLKMNEAKQKALRRKQNVQPYLLSCGSESSEKNYYLVIDDIKYKFTSPAKAFDTLFKSYHTFNATYPAAAEHLYLLIQNCVYDIQTKFDKTFPYIADVMTVAKV